MLPTAHAIRSPIELMVAAMRGVYTSRVQRARAEARNIRAIFVLSAQRHWRVWQNSHSDLLPNEVGEVSASYADGGVMGDTRAAAHDPSVRFADTSPSSAWGGNAMED